MSEILEKFNSDDLVDIGEKHHQAGRLSEAESFYRRALDIDPGHPGALYYLANIAYEDGRSSFATQLVEELLRSEPNDAEAWHLLGQIAVQEENLFRAGECFKNALTLQPDYVMALYGFGYVLQKQNDLPSALTHLQRAVTLNPELVEAYRLIGNILYTQRKFDDALAAYQRAINLSPDFKLAYEGVGGILLSQEKWDEAINIYQKAIAENAGSALIYVGLGMAYLRKNRDADAIGSFECAIDFDSNCFLAHLHLGNTLHKQGKFFEAVVFYEKAVALDATDIVLLKKYANTLLYNMRNYVKAAEIYELLLKLEPDNPIARHHLAACTGDGVPIRAEDAYVERTFDAFADKFDEVLEQTTYRGPQLLAQAIQRECGAPSKQFKILDAGCGTGLCGPLVSGYAETLTGVDLSAGMLAKASLRNVYDELIKAELTAYLQSQICAFDIILAGDTLIYFGAIEDLVTATRNALRNGGYFFFTAESNISDITGKDDYCLYPHGRYGHSEHYLRTTLQKSGFAIITMESAVLRYENSCSVQAFIVACRAVVN